MLANSYEPELTTNDPVPVAEGPSLGLVSTSVTTMIPRRDWKGGKKIAWQGNDMVHLGCVNDQGQTPNVVVKIQDFSNKKNEEFSCQPGTAMAQPLFTFMNDHLKTCMNVGLRAAGNHGVIKSVEINSKGTWYVRKERGGKEFSQHSTGRAIDVVSFNVTMDDGAKMTLPTSCIENPPGGLRSPGFSDKNSCKRVGDMGRFYDGFMKCWQDQVRLAKQNCEGLKDAFCRDLQNHGCSGNTNGALGVDDPDGDHKDHMHLSLPLCPKQKGIAQT